MNIVILTDSYYPDMSATSACIDKYIQKLKYKHSVDIICPISRVCFEDFNDPYLKLYYISNWLWRIRVWSKDNIRSGRYVIFGKLVNNIFRLRTFLFSTFYFPDIMKWEINEFYSKLKQISNEKQIDVIITVVNPINSAFAGLKFKREHPEIKWITYFTDPFTFHSFKYSYILFKSKRKKKNYKYEKMIYDTADYNLFTEELYKSALNDFMQSPSKTFCFKYALVHVKGRKISNISKLNVNIRLIYAGNIYFKRRNPNFMLSVISSIKSISLDMYIAYSNCDNIISKYLSTSIKRYSAVSRERYNEMISEEYDILVNIGNNFSLQIPSKLYELLSTGKPILNFYQVKDSQYEMIEKYPLGLNVEFNEPNAVEKVREFCLGVKGKRLTFEEVEQIYPENTLANQLELLEKLIRN